MSEPKLCPMLKVGMVMHTSATRDFRDPELEPATFLPCVQEKCAWWNDGREDYSISHFNADGDIIDKEFFEAIPGHCAILDIGRVR